MKIIILLLIPAFLAGCSANREDTRLKENYIKEFKFSITLHA
jgi:hypothetical protein